jgi:hypothetical protein
MFCELDQGLFGNLVKLPGCRPPLTTDTMRMLAINGTFSPISTGTRDVKEEYERKFVEHSSQRERCNCQR